MEQSKDWFGKVFAEYNSRKQAMFAFSIKQVEEQGVTSDEFRRDWISVGSAGLYLRKDIAKEFLARMERDSEAEKDSLPTLQLEWVGWRGMDHMTFRDKETGVYYCDTEYCKSAAELMEKQPNLAIVSPPYWEPERHVPNRFVVVKPPTAEQESWGF